MKLKLNALQFYFSLIRYCNTRRARRGSAGRNCLLNYRYRYRHHCLCLEVLHAQRAYDVHSKRKQSVVDTGLTTLLIQLQKYYILATAMITKHGGTALLQTRTTKISYMRYGVLWMGAGADTLESVMTQAMELLGCRYGCVKRTEAYTSRGNNKKG
jgi:hypothetical protein